MRISSIAVAALLAAASPAAAERHALSDTVAGHPGVTYASLLRQIIPDLKKDGDTWKGSAMAHYRHLFGKSSDNGPPESIAISEIDVHQAREGGKERLVLLTSNSDAPNEWFAILAAFDTAKNPRLLDAANIAGDQANAFFFTPKLPIGANSDVLFVTSTHWNSEQSYASISAVTLRNGKLAPALTVFTIDTHSCTYNRSQELTFSTKGTDISARIVETTALSGEDCGQKPSEKNGTRTITDTWTWNPKKNAYVPRTGAIDRLGKANMDGD